MASGSLDGEERGRRMGEVGGELESEGNSGGGPATGRAFDMLLILGSSSPWYNQFISQDLEHLWSVAEVTLEEGTGE